MTTLWLGRGCFCKHVGIDSELCQLFSANANFYPLAYYVLLYREEVYSSRYTRQEGNGVVEVGIVWCDWSILSTIQGWIQRLGKDRGRGVSTQIISKKLLCAHTCVMLFFNYTFFIKPQSYKMISHVIILNVHDNNNSRSMTTFWLSRGSFCKHVCIDVNSVSSSLSMGGFFSLAYYVLLHKEEVYSSRYTRREGNGVVEVLIVLCVYYPQYKGGSRGLEMVQGGDGAGIHTSKKLSCARTCVLLFFNYTFFIKPQSYKMISYFPQYNVRGIMGGGGVHVNYK